MQKVSCLAGECRRCAAALEERTPEADPGKSRENLELQEQDSLFFPLVELTDSEQANVHEFFSNGQL